MQGVVKIAIEENIFPLLTMLKLKKWFANFILDLSPISKRVIIVNNNETIAKVSGNLD